MGLSKKKNLQVEGARTFCTIWTQNTNIFVINVKMPNSYSELTEYILNAYQKFKN
jgi:hypothetical protein